MNCCLRTIILEDLNLDDKMLKRKHKKGQKDESRAIRPPGIKLGPSDFLHSLQSDAHQLSKSWNDMWLATTILFAIICQY